MALDCFPGSLSEKATAPKREKKKKRATSSQTQTRDAAAAHEASVIQSLNTGGHSIVIELLTLKTLLILSLSLWRRNTVHGQLLIRARRLLVSSERETLRGVCTGLTVSGRD